MAPQRAENDHSTTSRKMERKKAIGVMDERMERTKTSSERNGKTQKKSKTGKVKKTKDGPQKQRKVKSVTRTREPPGQEEP